MRAVYPFPLAQLADALPGWLWLVIYAVGFAAPLVGLLISFGLRTASRRKFVAVGIFYGVALSLYAAMAALSPTENLLLACSFLLLIPTGVMLGLILVASRGRVAEPRGFEVKLASDDEA